VIAAPRAAFTIPLQGRAPLLLGPRTLVMGVMNITPDSFSDGGHRLDPGRALEAALEMQEGGADLLDLGAESTRPGATPVDASEELHRLLPVLRALAPRLRVALSVDTSKAEVGRAALDEGAALVNDVSGLRFEPALGTMAAQRGAPVVLMHSRGGPGQMHAHAVYADLMAEVTGDLEAAIARAAQAGLGRDRLILDPGLGFSKTAAHSLAVLARLPVLAALGRPLLVGPSRKSFLSAAAGPMPAADRDWATAGAVTAAVLGGAHIVRVHRVAEMTHAIKLADAIRAAADAGPSTPARPGT